MPELCASDKCCGCTACFASCPASAIQMQADKNGFLHPNVEASRCVNCKLCEKVCPVLQRPKPRHPICVYAAKATDDSLRLTSSSGGLFSLFARQVLADGGVVYGAAIRESDLMVYHRSAENEDELSLLRGSKYVQSDMGDTYRRIKNELDSGRKVLFSGTPCQVAGLRSYLGERYENLLCIDVICHAAPSPLAWQRYLEARAEAIKGRGSVPVKVFDFRRVFFRRKNSGWRRYSLSLGFSSDKEYLGRIDEDWFLLGFMHELYNRCSCHHCSFRDLRSGSDLTIADFWSIEKVFPEMSDDKGVSIVVVNTRRGESVLSRIGENIIQQPTSFEVVAQYNPSLVRDFACSSRSGMFWGRVRIMNFDSLVEKCLRPSAYQRFRHSCGDVLRKVGLR